MAMVKQFTTSKTRLTIVVEKMLNGSYAAYEVKTRGKGGNDLILHSWCLNWLIETLHNRYHDETLISEV